MARIATYACIPTSDDVLVVIVPAEVSQVPVVCSPGRGHGRHAAVGVEMDVLDFGVLRHRAQSLLFHVELDLRHLGDPKQQSPRYVKDMEEIPLHTLVRSDCTGFVQRELRLQAG